MYNAFTNFRKDSIVQAASKVMLGEDVLAIQDKVKKLKVGDKTNFGIVKEIGVDSISFKANDTGVSRIKFNQRKMGSKDFVLDKLMKLKEDVENLDEANKEKIRAKIQDLKSLYKKFIDYKQDKDYTNKFDPQSRLFHDKRIKQIPTEISKLRRQLLGENLDEAVNLMPAYRKASKLGFDKKFVDTIERSVRERHSELSDTEIQKLVDETFANFEKYLKDIDVKEESISESVILEASKTMTLDAIAEFVEHARESGLCNESIENLLNSKIAE